MKKTSKLLIPFPLIIAISLFISSFNSDHKEVKMTFPKLYEEISEDELHQRLEMGEPFLYFNFSVKIPKNWSVYIPNDSFSIIHIFDEELYNLTDGETPYFETANTNSNEVLIEQIPEYDTLSSSILELFNENNEDYINTREESLKNSLNWTNNFFPNEPSRNIEDTSFEFSYFEVGDDISIVAIKESVFVVTPSTNEKELIESITFFREDIPNFKISAKTIDNQPISDHPAFQITETFKILD